MGPYVLPLSSVSLEQTASVGGKAATLGTLLGAGFPVPNGICLTTEAFRVAVRPHLPEIQLILSGHDLRNADEAHVAAEQVAALFRNVDLPEPVRRELTDHFRSTFPAGKPVAVRSTATAEDRPDVSFAGQYETVVGVQGEEAVAAAVLTCWRSFFSANALVARAGAGLTGEGEAMAVLIQEAVKSECAGVCFTADPVRRDRERILIEAVWGLGVGAVDGTVGTDALWVDRRTMAVQTRRIVEKPEQFVLNESGAMVKEVVPEDRREAACLPDPWAIRVAEFSLAAEYLLGRAQDVEWAVADEQVWLLQSRPITTLPEEVAAVPPFPVAWADTEEGRKGWRLMRFGSDGIPLPLEHDVIEAFTDTWREVGLFRGNEKIPQRHRVRGCWYSTPVTNPMREGDRRARQEAAKDLAAHVRDQGITLWEYWAPDVMAAVKRLGSFDLGAADGPKLAEHLEDAFGAFRRHWVVHWLMGPMWMPFREPYQKAFSAVTGLKGEEAERAGSYLLDGEDNDLTRLIDGLYSLGQVASRVPKVKSLLATPSGDTLQRVEQVPGSEPFRQEWEKFISAYGERQGAGFGSPLTILRPTWREDPRQVLDLVAPYLNADAPAPASLRERAQQARDARLEEIGAACADAAAVAELRQALPFARRVATDLENHNHWIDQMTFGQLRRAIMGAAAWLTARGDLKSSDEIFWLQRDEIVQALRAESAVDFRSTLATREAQHKEWAELTYPPVLGAPDQKLPKRPSLKDEAVADGGEDPTRLTGYGASPGRVRGRARVVPESVLLPRLAPGEILVAENAGPLWTPLFPRLGGLVLDQGAINQHAATTAREYGVPSVMGTRNATKRIPEGAWVTIDGSAGTVEIEAADGKEN